MYGPVTGGGQVNYTCWNDATGGNTLATSTSNPGSFVITIGTDPKAFYCIKSE